MIGKIPCLICFGLLGSLRHPSRAADIDARGRRWFARTSRFAKLDRKGTIQRGMLQRMYSTVRKKREFGTASEYIQVLERPRLLPFEIIVVDPFDRIRLRRAYSDIEVDE